MVLHSFTSHSLNLGNRGWKEICSYREWTRRHLASAVKYHCLSSTCSVVKPKSTHQLLVKWHWWKQSKTEGCNFFFFLWSILLSKVTVCLVEVNFCWIYLHFRLDWRWWLMSFMVLSQDPRIWIISECCRTLGIGVRLNSSVEISWVLHVLYTFWLTEIANAHF